MVRETMYNKIQGYKQIGYSIRKTSREAGINRKTVKKYWEMGVSEYAQYIKESSERLKILAPYRSEIENLLENYANITSAIIHDRLREKHAEFTANYQTVRLYVKTLREVLGIPTEKAIRQYSEVSELSPGVQAQVDMGRQILTDIHKCKVKIYIFSMVMSHSRKKFVYFQDKAFNAEEFIKAHDLAFKYFGGRTDEIAYDQDRVMAIAENAGDIIYTEAFENYRKYAGFNIYLCRGHDPESKGKIENAIKYVKGNFLAYRIYSGIPTLNSEGLAWLERTANAKIHDTTKMIPNVVFAEEIKHLKAVPTLSEPPKPKSAIVRKTNVVHYMQNRYEVPCGTYKPGRTATITVDDEAGKAFFADPQTGELFATHNIAYGAIGKKIPLPQNAERFRETKYEEVKVLVLSAFEGVYLLEEYADKLMSSQVPISLAKQFNLSVLSTGRFEFRHPEGEAGILEILRAEAAAREKRAIAERTKKARLPIFKSFKAVERGYKVSFSTMETLMHVLKTQEIPVKSAARVRWINKCDLVIIDEVGYLPLSSTEANLFFSLISQLYENTSVVITSNKGFSGWADLLGDSVLATALLDRLTHKCQVLTF